MKNLDYGYLLEFYKAVLPKKQYEALDLYYNQDLSLAEIAESFHITRQGVRDAIKRGEAELKTLEEKLGLVKKLKSIESAVLTIKEQAVQSGCPSCVVTMLEHLAEELYQ